MRLLSVETLQLETFSNEATTPPFAILSHTWGDDEVTLQDLHLPPGALSAKRGWQKIVGFRDALLAHPQLLGEPIRYIWVDTCCIDKTSSAELSEAINSMFRWYRNAVCCFALLSDVTAPDEDGARVGEDFEASRWFTRGWTLQELLAPRDVYFFDREWSWVGSKKSLVERISQRTKIDEETILSGEWPFATVAQRMSWAAGRVTTRTEDIAYCLLGIFGVSMPMLYGEGEGAFIRLQEEIIKESDDHSIFAWDASGISDSVQAVGVFARHPRTFRDGASIELLPNQGGPFTLTNKGLQISLPVIEYQDFPGQKIALLSCSDVKDVTSLIGIKLQPDPAVNATYSRLPAAPCHIAIQNPAVWQNSVRTIYLVKRDQQAREDTRPVRCHLRGPSGPLAGLEFIQASPAGSWNLSKTRTMTMMVPRAPGESGGGTATALLFRLSNTESTFFLVLDILPAANVARAGLVLGPDTLPEGPALNIVLERLKGSASLVAKSQSAELALGGRVVSVETIAKGAGSSIMGVTLRVR